MKFQVESDVDANCVYVTTSNLAPVTQEEFVSFSATVIIDRDAQGDIVGVEVV